MKGGSYKYPVGYKNTYIEILSVEKNHFDVYCSLCGSKGTLNRQAILSKLLACDKCRKEYCCKKVDKNGEPLLVNPLSNKPKRYNRPNTSTEKSIEEIAMELGMSDREVARTLRNALKKLVEAIGDEKYKWMDMIAEDRDSMYSN